MLIHATTNGDALPAPATAPRARSKVATISELIRRHEAAERAFGAAVANLARAEKCVATYAARGDVPKLSATRLQACRKDEEKYCAAAEGILDRMLSAPLTTVADCAAITRHFASEDARGNQFDPEQLIELIRNVAAGLAAISASQ